MRVRIVLGLAPAIALGACSSDGEDAAPSPVPARDRFQFAVIGDYPYLPEDVPKFDRLIDAVNAEAPALVLHVGDISNVACTDAALNTSWVGSGDGRPIENVTRLENFGEREVHWSRVTVDPTGPELFVITPGIVAGNVVPHPVPPR